jgi:hypothetical protein
MFVTVEVKQASSDGLRERTYNFIALDGLDFVLNSYTLTVRESKRHQPKLREIYKRTRVSTLYVGVLEHIQPPEVPKSVVRAFYRKVHALINLQGYSQEE